MNKRPSHLRYHKKSRVLDVEFNGGESYALPAEYLRVYSPSAEVRGHGAAEPLLILEKENVGITRIEAVGNYAIRLYFSDGHQTGLYSWDVLEDLGSNHAAYWTRYLERLQAAGIERKPVDE